MSANQCRRRIANTIPNVAFLFSWRSFSVPLWQQFDTCRSFLFLGLLESEGIRPWAIIVGALWFFSIAMVFQFAEVLLEILDNLVLALPEGDVRSGLLSSLYSASDSRVPRHHRHERKHVRIEHSVTKYVWSLMQSRDKTFKQNDFIRYVLSKVVFRAFATDGATRVWLWLPVEGKLRARLKRKTRIPHLPRTVPSVNWIPTGAGQLFGPP